MNDSLKALERIAGAVEGFRLFAEAEAEDVLASALGEEGGSCYGSNSAGGEQVAGFLLGSVTLNTSHIGEYVVGSCGNRWWKLGFCEGLAELVALLLILR